MNKNLGWVERSEAQHRNIADWKVGLRDAQPNLQLLVVPVPKRNTHRQVRMT
jgi:hypothetical protein